MTKAQLARAQWLEERKTYVGATEVAAIMGIHPYDSAREVWLRKRGLISEKEATIPMELGTYLEPFIAAQYTKATGIKTRKSKTYRHAKFSFCACNPDREVWLTVDGQRYRGGLELKSVGHWASANFGQDGSDQIPDHYLIQVLWQLIVARFDFVQLVALIDNREMRVFTYSLNPALSSRAHIFPEEEAKALFTAVVKWWNRHMIEGIEPEITGHDADTERMRSDRQDYENGFTAKPDAYTDNECHKLRRSLARLERAEFCVAERKNRIKKFMAEVNASVLKTRYGVFTWKTNVKGVAVFIHPYKSNRS